MSAYVPSNQDVLQIFLANIAFTAVTDTYDPDATTRQITGKITIYDDSSVIESVGGDGALIDGTSVDIPGIHTEDFHIFYGGVIS